MQVRSNVMMFIGGSRLRVDPAAGLTPPFEYQVEEGKALPPHLFPADGSVPVRSAVPPGQAAAPVRASGGPLSKKEIMAQLSAAGVKYSATQKAEDLLKLLEAHKKKEAPAASTAPPKGTEKEEAPGPKGSGDQEVI